MACQGPPTETQYGTFTTNSQVFSTATATTIIPPTTSTTVITTCTPLPTIGTPTFTPGAGCTTITSVTTIPGRTSTVLSVITANVLVTTTAPTLTLYGTCDGGASPTPPPVINTMTSYAQSTMPGGGITSYVTVITSTEAATQIAAPTGSVSAKSKTSIAPIIGGAVGGIVALVLIAALVWYFIRRRSNPPWDDIFEKDGLAMPAPVRATRDRNTRPDLGDAEPQPYHYGLVGQAAPPPSQSPPFAGAIPVAAVQQQQQQPQRQTSMSAASMMGTMYQPTVTSGDHSSRPDTASASSARPLMYDPNAPNAQYAAAAMARQQAGSPGSDRPLSHASYMSGGPGPAPGAGGMYNPYVEAMSVSGSGSGQHDDPRRLQVANPPGENHVVGQWPADVKRDPALLPTSKAAAVVHQDGLAGDGPTAGPSTAHTPEGPHTAEAPPPAYFE